MSKRSTLLIAAFALVASLALTTPSRAGNSFVITSETIASNTVTVSPTTNPASTFTAAVASFPSSSYQLPASLVNIGSYSATAGTSTTVTVNGAVVYDVWVKDLASNMTGKLVIDVNFNGQMNNATSIIGIQSVTMTDTMIGNNLYHLTGFAAQFSGPNTNNILLGLAVPEPASMSLLGIGVAGLLSFRRIFKRKAAV